jgi:D-sedoheptulose 7-phosphate isomerase
MNSFSSYIDRLSLHLNSVPEASLTTLQADLFSLWSRKGSLFLCGNGGSAGNATHLANDFIFGAGYPTRHGLSVESLSSNPAVLTCLSNDIGYDQIFSYQLECKAKKGDILMAFSGSGNSSNIICALDTAKKLGCKTYAILGFNGGLALRLADVPIHVDCDDMQICEDIQLVIGHYLVQCLNKMALYEFN